MLLPDGATIIKQSVAHPRDHSSTRGTLIRLSSGVAVLAYGPGLYRSVPARWAAGQEATT